MLWMAAAAVLFKPSTSEKAENVEWPASDGVIGDDVNRPPGMDDGTKIWHEKWPYGSFVSQLQIDLKMPIFWHVLEESVEHNDFSE